MKSEDDVISQEGDEENEVMDLIIEEDYEFNNIEQA